MKCDACRHEKLVAFSCKRRGFCPSCGARRMAETAAHLVEHVLPEQPIRQWVLSFPYPLRLRVIACIETPLEVPLATASSLTHRDHPHPSRRARDRQHPSPPRTTAPCASHPTPGLPISGPVLTAPDGARQPGCASPPVPCALQRLPDMRSSSPARNRITSTPIRPLYRLSHQRRTPQRPDRYSRNHCNRRLILPILQTTCRQWASMTSTGHRTSSRRSASCTYRTPHTSVFVATDQLLNRGMPGAIMEFRNATAHYALS